MWIVFNPQQLSLAMEAAAAFSSSPTMLRNNRLGLRPEGTTMGRKRSVSKAGLAAINLRHWMLTGSDGFQRRLGTMRPEIIDTTTATRGMPLEEMATNRLRWMIDTHDGWLTELRLREERELSETTAKQQRERNQSRIRTTDYTPKKASCILESYLVRTSSLQRSN